MLRHAHSYGEQHLGVTLLVWSLFLSMESSMFVYSIGRFIFNHTNEGFNFVEVDGSI